MEVEEAYYDIYHGEDQVSDNQKLKYFSELICKELDLTDLKIRQCKEIVEQIDFRSVEFNDVAMAGAIVHLVSLRDPIAPRWMDLVSDICNELSNQRKSFQRTYSSKNWRTKIQRCYSQLQGRDFYSDNVTGVHYMYEVLELQGFEGLSREEEGYIRKFCMSMMPLLENSPSYIEDCSNDYISKKRVTLAGAILYIGSYKVLPESKQLGVEDVASTVQRELSRIMQYSAMINDDVFDGELDLDTDLAVATCDGCTRSNCWKVEEDLFLCSNCQKNLSEEEKQDIKELNKSKGG